MKKPKFSIAYPKYKADDYSFIENEQIRTFYGNLKLVLKDMGYENEFINRAYKIPPHNGDICLGYHSKGAYEKNIWHVKDACFRDHWSVDRLGFAGWSEMSSSKKMYEDSQKVDLDKATEFFDNFREKYIQTNTSKVTQPVVLNNIKIKEPYIFFAGQIRQDAVIKFHAKIDPIVHSNSIPKYFNSIGYNTLFKKHPGLKGIFDDRFEIEPKEQYYIINTNNSIHDSIPNASAVVCINSGVGFEALLYKKHVFISGHCEYHWVAHKLYSLEDFKKIPNIMNTKINEEKLIKFMYYILYAYYVNSTNLDSIERKLSYIVKEYYK